LRYLLHHSDSCYSQGFIEKSQPAGTVLSDQFAMTKEAAFNAWKRLDKNEKKD
jgi:hypothetical protein